MAINRVSHNTRHPQTQQSRPLTINSIQIIVVGAGPSGLLLALLLAKQNIQVDLVEARPTLNEQPRAAHYASQPPTNSTARVSLMMCRLSESNPTA